MHRSRRPRALVLTRALSVTMACLAVSSHAQATPRTPVDESEVLAELPAGVHPVAAPVRSVSATRLDVALPLAQFDIGRARASGDLRFLGYAEATLDPWMKRRPVAPQVLVLHAIILQSRHAFEPALAELDQALQAQPDDAQGWLTRVTVLRVLGRIPEALDSCGQLERSADVGVTALCRESLRGLSGHLTQAYAALQTLDSRQLPPALQAWRLSELGEMAARRGDDAAAARWFEDGLKVAPQDFYLRGALADVWLRQNKAADTLRLLDGYESMEPMMLRIAIAHRMLRDGAGERTRTMLANAFDVEERRGEAIHRREQARYWLDVDPRPEAALAAALENWRVQREPDDALVLLRAAAAAHRPEAAADARRFIEHTGLEDARFAGLLGQSV